MGSLRAMRVSGHRQHEIGVWLTRGHRRRTGQSRWGVQTRDYNLITVSVDLGKVCLLLASEKEEACQGFPRVALIRSAQVWHRTPKGLSHPWSGTLYTSCRVLRADLVQDPTAR